jgi:hypothetical protein
MPNSKVELPATVDEVVRLLQGLVPDEDQAENAFMSENKLTGLDFGHGTVGGDRGGTTRRRISQEVPRSWRIVV